MRPINGDRVKSQGKLTPESLSRNMAFRQTHSAAESATPQAADEADEAGGAGGGGGEGGEGTEPAAGPHAVSLADEQAYVTMLYGLLDAARARSEEALKDVNAQGRPGGTHQARLERDVSAAERQARLAQLNGIARGLGFGRTADESGLALYIGRIGLPDDG